MSNPGTLPGPQSDQNHEPEIAKLAAILAQVQGDTRSRNFEASAGYYDGVSRNGNGEDSFPWLTKGNMTTPSARKEKAATSLSIARRVLPGSCPQLILLSAAN